MVGESIFQPLNQVFNLQLVFRSLMHRTPWGFLKGFSANVLRIKGEWCWVIDLEWQPLRERPRTRYDPTTGILFLGATDITLLERLGWCLLMFRQSYLRYRYKELFDVPRHPTWPEHLDHRPYSVVSDCSLTGGSPRGEP